MHLRFACILTHARREIIVYNTLFNQLIYFVPISNHTAQRKTN